MQLQAKEAYPILPADDNKAGLYLHVPFCASKCRYCVFYATAPRRADIEGYLEAVAKEWDDCGADGGVFESCFFGGGTPGVLGVDDLKGLAAVLRARGFAPKEWTVELSPSTALPARLAALREIGVNRVSLGVQSFDDGLLAALGRRSTAAQTLRAVENIKAAGFDNFNLDLMIALPGQTPRALLDDMERAAACGPAHISTYCLTLEDDAELLAALRARGWERDEGRERECYLAAWERLPQLGYAHYEVSNFAKPGRECIHNLNTWNMGRWLGLGPSAASQWGMRRWSNAPDLARWRARVLAGEPARADETALTPESLLADALIFGLRLNAGVDIAALAARFGARRVARYAGLWPRLEDEGFLRVEGTRRMLTTEGRLVADAVGLAVLEQGDSNPR